MLHVLICFCQIYVIFSKFNFEAQDPRRKIFLPYWCSLDESASFWTIDNKDWLPTFLDPITFSTHVSNAYANEHVSNVQALVNDTNCHALEIFHASDTNVDLTMSWKWMSNLVRCQMPLVGPLTTIINTWYWLCFGNESCGFCCGN
jgi:hypothetical protein